MNTKNMRIDAYNTGFRPEGRDISAQIDIEATGIDSHRRYLIICHTTVRDWLQPADKHYRMDVSIKVARNDTLEDKPADPTVFASTSEIFHDSWQRGSNNGLASRSGYNINLNLLRKYKPDQEMPRRQCTSDRQRPRIAAFQSPVK